MEKELLVRKNGCIGWMMREWSPHFAVLAYRGLSDKDVRVRYASKLALGHDLPNPWGDPRNDDERELQARIFDLLDNVQEDPARRELVHLANIALRESTDFNLRELVRKADERNLAWMLIQACYNGKHGEACARRLGIDMLRYEDAPDVSAGWKRIVRGLPSVVREKAEEWIGG